MTPSGVQEYLQFVSEQLVHELGPILKIKQATSNSSLLGAFAEAAIRRLVRRAVHPLTVSTGAVLDFPIPSRLNQLDAIIWSPFPAPAVFEVDEFALVPRSNVFGILEIKRSGYAGATDKLEEFLRFSPGLVADAPGSDRSSTLAVVCLLDGTPSPKLQRLLDEKRAVAIFQKSSSDEIEVRSSDVCELVNYLHYVTWRYRRAASADGYLQLAGTQPADA